MLPHSIMCALQVELKRSQTRFKNIILMCLFHLCYWKERMKIRMKIKGVQCVKVIISSYDDRNFDIWWSSYHYNAKLQRRPNTLWWAVTSVFGSTLDNKTNKSELKLKRHIGQSFNAKWTWIISSFWFEFKRPAVSSSGMNS